MSTSRLIVIIAVVAGLCLGVGESQTIVVTGPLRTVTLTWDPVTRDVENCLVTGAVSYCVYATALRSRRDLEPVKVATNRAHLKCWEQERYRFKVTAVTHDVMESEPSEAVELSL